MLKKNRIIRFIAAIAAVLLVLVVLSRHTHSYRDDIRRLIAPAPPRVVVMGSWLSTPRTRELMYEEVSKLVRSKPTVIEIGAWKGVNAAALLRALRPGKLILSDLWAETSDPRYKARNEDLVRKRFANEISAGIVKVRKGPSKEQIEMLEDRSIDFFYLDTTHKYELTRDELERAQRVIAPGGFLCGHNFVHDGRANYGVIPAVVEFALEEKWSITHISRKKSSTRSFCMRRMALHGVHLTPQR